MALEAFLAGRQGLRAVPQLLAAHPGRRAEIAIACGRLGPGPDAPEAARALARAVPTANTRREASEVLRLGF